MRKLVIPIALAMLSSSAFAKPSYSQARAFYDQLKQPLYDTGLFYKKPFNERVAYMNTAKTLRDKAEKMFGVPSSCYQAASTRLDYISHLHDFANRLEGRISTQLTWNGITDPMYGAFTYGESTSACYNDVEALDTAKK